MSKHGFIVHGKADWPTETYGQRIFGWRVTPPDDVSFGLRLDVLPEFSVALAAQELLEALKSARMLLSSHEGISRNNFSNLADEEIEKIDKILSKVEGEQQ